MSGGSGGMDVPNDAITIVRLCDDLTASEIGFSSDSIFRIVNKTQSGLPMRAMLIEPVRSAIMPTEGPLAQYWVPGALVKVVEPSAPRKRKRPSN